MVEKVPGSLFIVAAPSGGGKTSLVKKIATDMNDIEISISHTTRTKRPGEQQGVDYYFVDEATFTDMIHADDFIEYASVFNHYYGTSKSQIYQRLQAGIDILLDIDWQGAQQIRSCFPGAVSIFILPPSVETLKQRLYARKQDDATVIQRRMQQAQDEMEHYIDFDYLIVNEQFSVAADALKSIVTAQRLQTHKQAIKYRKLLSFLLTSQ